MTSYMRTVKHEPEEDSLYPWGVAEITDKWVLLHRDGLPRWAIFYKGKGRTIVVPCYMLRSQMRVQKRKKPMRKGSNT